MGFLDFDKGDDIDEAPLQEIIAHADHLLNINRTSPNFEGAEQMRKYTEKLTMQERGYVIACLLGEIQRLNRIVGGR